MAPPYPIEGPDVSVYQDYNKDGQFVPVDFTKVKNTRSSIRFIGIKTGEGVWSGYPEEVFLRQFLAATMSGVDVVFPYHYWHVEISPQSQASYFRKRLLDVLPSIDLTKIKLAVDIEDTDDPKYRASKNTMTQADIVARTPVAKQMTASLRDYLDAVSQINGEPCLWYGADWYESWFLWLAEMSGMDMSFTQKYPRWIASYTSPFMVMPYLCRLQNVWMWQDTSVPDLTRQMQGFPYPTHIDNSWFIKSEIDFKKLFHLEEKPQPVLQNRIFMPIVNT
jgi:GH25 family lysozyme M1 (1,4-beta-N-acetylmuramidase)